MAKFKILKQGVHQPLVMGIQEVLGLEVDGFFGPITDKAVREWQESEGLEVDGEFGLMSMAKMKDKIDYRYRILQVIAEFEGACTVKNGWAYTSVVPNDGAGTNYGVMQMNRYGSLQDVKKNYGCTGPAWFGTVAGAQGQFKYFCDRILEPSIAIAKMIGDESHRCLLVLCDARVQGGGFYPSRPRPITNWKDWKLTEEDRKAVEKNFKDLPPKEAYVKSIKDYCCPARMFAELYPRYGNPTFLGDQLSRRRTAVCGKGEVHDDYYEMEDYGL